MMNNSKLEALLIVLVVTLVISLFLVTLFVRHLKSKCDEDGRLKVSYGIWFAALVLTALSIVSSILHVSSDAIDNLSKFNLAKPLVEKIRVLAIIVGIGFVWYVLWYFIVKFISRLAFPVLNEEKEMDEDGAGYFLIKAATLFGVVMVSAPVLEMIMRLFVPTIEIPFYH